MLNIAAIRAEMTNDAHRCKWNDDDYGLCDEVERLQQERDDEWAKRIAVTEEANSQLHALRERVTQLETVLRAVKADRPTAHSDAVWAQINDALAASPEPADTRDEGA